MKTTHSVQMSTPCLTHALANPKGFQGRQAGVQGGSVMEEMEKKKISQRARKHKEEYYREPGYTN